MAINRRPKVAYGLSEPDFATSPIPIVVNRAPTTADFAELGTMWLNPLTNEAWTLTSVVTNIANWLPLGITDYGVGTDGQVLIAATGALPTFNAITAGPAINVGLAPHHTTIGLTNGTNGQVLIGGGAAPIWASVTGTNILMTAGANTLAINAGGGTAGQVLTSTGGATAATWQAPAGGGMTWQGSVGEALVANNGYVVVGNIAGGFTLPAAPALGDTFTVASWSGYGANNSWVIYADANHTIEIGSQTAATSIASTVAGDVITLTCVFSAAPQYSFLATSVIGNITVTP